MNFSLLSFVAGVVVGGIGILVWNAVNPNKVAKFTAKYRKQIEEELSKLKNRGL